MPSYKVIFQEEEKSKLIIKIWPPNKIKYAYLDTNYFSGSGVLGNSCMRHKVNQKALNFYVKNNVKIVVLIDNRNKIYGRALLWDNVNSIKGKKSFTYLDRVYVNSDILASQFYDLAKENKWKYYPSTSAGVAKGTYYKNDINVIDIFHFPYTDTFRHLYYKDNVISSAKGLVKVEHTENYIYLIHTNDEGYFPELDPNKIREVFSGNFMSKKDAIYIKKYRGWVLKSHIANIGGTYYSIYDEDIVQTAVDGWILKKNSVSEVFTNETININKAKKSIKYNGYVHKSNALYIENELYHKLDADIVCFENKWYHISQCFVNYNRESRNKELANQSVSSFTSWVPHEGVVKEGALIPKIHAVIAYNLIYNPIINDIEYQVVYCTDKTNLIWLTTGEFVVNSKENRVHLKRFNNKYYIKQDSKLHDKNQLLLFK